MNYQEDSCTFTEIWVDMFRHKISKLIVIYIKICILWNTYTVCISVNTHPPRKQNDCVYSILVLGIYKCTHVCRCKKQPCIHNVYICIYTYISVVRPLGTINALTWCCFHVFFASGIWLNMFASCHWSASLTPHTPGHDMDDNMNFLSVPYDSNDSWWQGCKHEFTLHTIWWLSI